MTIKISDAMWAERNVDHCVLPKIEALGDYYAIYYLLVFTTCLG